MPQPATAPSILKFENYLVGNFVSITAQSQKSTEYPYRKLCTFNYSSHPQVLFLS